MIHSWVFDTRNKKMSLVPFTFKNVELKVVTINGKPWTRAMEVCKALEYNKKTAHVIRAHCSRENYAHKYDLTSVPTAGTPVNWPKDSQKYNLYINEEGMHELVFSSQQQKAKAFRKYCCNEMFPRIRKQLVDKMQEDHQQAITDRNNRVQAIEYENVGLQGEIKAKDQQIEASQHKIAEPVERYVDHCRSPSRDNIVIIVRKHTTPENDKYHNLPYYIARIQRRKRYVKLQWLERHFPDYEVIVEIGNPNSIHAFNRFEEEGHVERKFNHFRLIDLTRDNLYDMGISGGDYDED